MRRQYLDLKAKHPEAILFFRLGDFYETFDDDAETCARLLQITLTGREMGRGLRVPMAGVPFHAVQGYLARLVQLGRTVAVCEQVEDARPGAPARGMMAREVTRIVTPGTVVEPGMLDGARNNFLLAVVATPVARGGDFPTWAIAYADVSTGEFRCTQFGGPDGSEEVRREIARIDPAECIVPRAEAGPTLEAAACAGRVVTRWDAWRWELGAASQALGRAFGVATLSGFGLDDLPEATRAAGALVAYLANAHAGRPPALDGVATYLPGRHVRLDPFTRRNLDLDVPARGSGPSLLRTIDETRTAPGARLLRRWVGQPLVDVDAIRARHDCVASLFGDGGRRGAVRTLLGSVADVERIASRAANGSATPRDLHAMRESLGAAGRIAEALRDGPNDAAAALADGIDPCVEVQDLVERAIFLAPRAAPATPGRFEGAASNGRGAGDPLAAEPLVRPGFSRELDGLVAGVQEARRWIAGLEGVERERTGIPTLKVGYNRVFGYYIHVPTRHADRVPADYVRRQTVADGERFVTSDLKAKEDVVIEAAAAIAKAERQAYDGVLATIAADAERLRATASALAAIDVVAGLAEVAVRRGYVRPDVDAGTELEIHGGRHPVVEASMDGDVAFVPNDCVLDGTGRWALILTGPNMAGKSTYLRSVALIVLMAQAGSFVPAMRARIGVVDRVFTRVGAHDDLAAGRSTFMVEMVEAAQILRYATGRSLVILDEIGRGTGTRDGLAIAQAVVEYLHGRGGHEADASAAGRTRTLFATHYHELASLESTIPGVANARLEVLEEGDRVAFLHRVVPGAAGRSYGIHVARLAGMPRAVTDRAAALLADDADDRTPGGTDAPARTGRGSGAGKGPSDGDAARRVTGTPARVGPMQLTLFAPPSHPVAEAIREVDVEALTPLEALNLLAKLRGMVDRA